MAAITRQLPSALPGRRAGSFAGKATPTAVGHYEPLLFTVGGEFTIDLNKDPSYNVLLPKLVAFDVDLRD